VSLTVTTIVFTSLIYRDYSGDNTSEVILEDEQKIRDALRAAGFTDFKVTSKERTR